MLFLIRADGNHIRLVKQNVARHQHRVSEEAGVDIVRVAGGFIFELRHSSELAELGDVGHDPRELGVGIDLALDEEQTLFRIDPAGKEQREGVPSLFAQLRRLLIDGQGMKVGDEIRAVELVLHASPIADGADVIAQCENSGRLNAAENDLFIHECCPLSKSFLF